jgi:hypothetical protein
MLVTSLLGRACKSTSNATSLSVEQPTPFLLVTNLEATKPNDDVHLQSDSIRDTNSASDSICHRPRTTSHDELSRHNANYKGVDTNDIAFIPGELAARKWRNSTYNSSVFRQLLELGTSAHL